MRDLRSTPDWPARVAEGLPPEIAGDTPLDRFGLITALPTGDMLADLFVPMLDVEGAAEEYPATLRRLESLAGDVEVVVPGHGAVGGAGAARARVDPDRTYVLALRDGRESGDPRLEASADPAGSG